MMMSLNAVYIGFLSCVLPWTQSQGTGPFLQTGNKTATAALGESVLLECAVVNPDNYSVSWYFWDHNVRISDNLNVLIASKRYNVEQPRYAGGNTDGNRTVYFSLNILHLKSSDQGTYYCKVEGMDDQMTYDLIISDTKRPTPPHSVPIANHTDCCIKEKVSAGCLPVCDRTTLPPGFNPSLCSGDVLKLIKCGTDGRNHVSCCRRRQVPVNCLELCSSSNPTIGIDQLICDQYDPQIDGCYNEGQVTLPSPPREVTAAPTTNGIMVDWLTPEENGDLVTGYRVSYRFAQKASPTFQTTEVLTVDSRSKLVRVPKGGRYQVYVTAISPHGASLPSPVIEVYTGPNSDPNSAQNVKIKECCTKHHVLFECEDNFCNTGGFRAMENLNVHYCQADLPNIFHCVAGGQDHTPCCKSRGFAEQCLPLCSGQTVAFNETLLACLVHLQTVEECLQEGFTVLPAAPQNVRAESIGTSSAVLEWDMAYAGAAPVDQYIVHYRMRTPAGLVPYQEIVTQGLFAILPSLRPDTIYDAKVTSEYGLMSSPPSPTLIFQTYSEEHFNTSSPADNSTEVIPSHPDMAACCERKGVPEDCLWICSYHLDFHETLKNNRTELSRCDPYIKEMLTCASDNRNHTPCCEASLVPQDCLFMCSFRSETTAQNITSFCVPYFPAILNCYKSGVVSLPRSPVNVTVLNVTAHTITLQWEPDTMGPRPMGYILQYTTLGSIQEVGAVPTSYWQQDTTNRTVHILQNLKSGFYYLISVVSENQNGSSVPREYIPVLTNADDGSGIGFTTPGPGTTPHPAGVKPTEPPVNRTDCCTAKGVSRECLSVCEQGDLTNTTCSDFVFFTLACSADGGDHSNCCRRRDVPRHCWGLCSGQTHHEDNPVSVFCASYADVIMFCTQRSAVDVPSQPRNFRIAQINSRSLRLLWDPPLRNAEGCTYIVNYGRFKDGYLRRRTNIPDVTSPFLLRSLEPDTLYEVHVLARKKNGYSQPSTKHLVTTQAEVPLQAHIYQVPIGIIDEGKAVTLTCGFSGSPAPFEYRWLLNSKFLTTGYSYNIPKAARHNEGWYTCQLKSLIDTDKHSRYLPVRYKPEVIYIQSDSAPPGQHYTAHVTCMFKGHPTLVQWQKDNQPVNSSRIFSQKSREHITNGTTVAVLEIGLIDYMDYGHYTCNGSNSFGSAQGVAQITNPETIPQTTAPPSLPSAPNMTDMVTIQTAATDDGRRIASPSAGGGERDQHIIGRPSAQPWTRFNVRIRLYSCCMSKGVPTDLLDLCTSKFANAADIKQNIDIFQYALQCAADERDNTKCCQKSRVSDLCWPLCAGNLLDEADLPMCARSGLSIMDCLEAGQKSLPSPPLNLIAHAPHLGDLALSWEAPLKNPDKVAFYHILYYRKGDPSGVKQISVDNTYKLYHLKVTHEGVYTVWVVAGNPSGQSANSSLQIVTVSDLLPSAPRDLHGQLLSDRVISLTWKSADVRTAPFDNYTVFYRHEKYPFYKNITVTAVTTSVKLENLNLQSEYEIFVKAQNKFGLGDKSNTIYIDTGEIASKHTDAEGVNSVALGVGLTVLILVLIAIILLAVYYFRVRRNSLKEPGAVSFENPSYAEGNNSVQISGLRNDVPDRSTMQPTPSATQGAETFDYGKLHDDGYSTCVNPNYATLDVTQTNAVKTQQVSLSVDKDNSEA